MPGGTHEMKASVKSRIFFLSFFQNAANLKTFAGLRENEVSDTFNVSDSCCYAEAI